MLWCWFPEERNSWKGKPSCTGKIHVVPGLWWTHMLLMSQSESLARSAFCQHKDGWPALSLSLRIYPPSNSIFWFSTLTDWLAALSITSRHSYQLRPSTKKLINQLIDKVKQDTNSGLLDLFALECKICWKMLCIFTLCARMGNKASWPNIDIW